ncbi:MAG: hypothetical protein HYZ93_01240 [Candidatus Omnitrophica bacterium]|nr:hypothetical protein [Candidatus Omnitrophota bacterium]
MEATVKKFWLTACIGFLLTASSSQLTAFAEPSAEQLRQTIRNYIQWQEKGLGSFTIPDPREKGRLRTLSLVRVHDRVGKTGDYYYSCTDMKDVATGDQLDLDFDVSDTGKALQVVAVRIHKDNGKPRYTYDAQDNLVPLN